MKNGSRYRMRGNQNLFLLFMFALVLRLIFWVFIAHHPERAFDDDSKEYLLLAETLLDSHTFPSILRTPVYPFFIASTYALFGKLPQAVLVFQYVCDGATAVIVALLFFRIFQNARYSFLAGFLYAINPFAIFYSHMVLSETVFTFLFAASVYLFITFLQSRERTHLALSSLLLGTAALCRPIALYIPLLLAPFLLLAGYSFRERFMNLLIFSVMCSIVLIPWYVKNHRDFGRWTLSTVDELNVIVSFAPEVLMIKNNPLSMFAVNVNKGIEPFQAIMRDRIQKKYASPETDPRGKENAPSPALIREEGMKVIYENPSIFVLSHVVNIGRVLVPYYPSFHRFIGSEVKMLSLLSFVIDVLIMGSFVLGVFFPLQEKVTMKSEKIAVLMMVCLIVYFSFVPGIVGYSRFRVPIVPYISIFSALGVRKILARVRSVK